MDRGPPPHKSKIRINYCLPTDLRTLPGVGQVSAQTIINARDRCDNLTQELFMNLNIRKPETLLKYLDFTPFPHAHSSPAMAKHPSLGNRDEEFLETLRQEISFKSISMKYDLNLCSRNII